MHIYIYKKTFFFHWGLPFNSRVTHLHRTTMSADYLSGKYCVRFFRHLKVKNKVIVVICAGKSNIKRVDGICTWTEMWKQIQKMSSLDSRQNINEQENHEGGKGKGMGAKGQKGKRAKTTNCNFPPFLFSLHYFAFHILAFKTFYWT